MFLISNRLYLNLYRTHVNYGSYGKEARSGKSKSPREGGSYLHEEDFEDKD